MCLGCRPPLRLKRSPPRWGKTIPGVRLFWRRVACLCWHGRLQGLDRVENRHAGPWIVPSPQPQRRAGF